MHYTRTLLPKIDHYIGRDKIIILYGARQVGKTTLAKQLLDRHGGIYMHCELPKYRAILEAQDIERFYQMIQNQPLVVLDEAQTIENIGLFLKLMIDSKDIPPMIATGSSSFDLANKTQEPLTGRSIQFMLYPLSIEEIESSGDHPLLSFTEELSSCLIYGTYPAVMGKSEEDARIELANIAGNYLYKDILTFESLRRPHLLDDLLALLALQLGNEVSYQELAKSLKTNVPTIQRYLDLLEKTFVIFQLRGFSRNLRKEVSKSQKIYFYDLGFRNFVINNYNPLVLRNDVGILWENFCISERMKYHHNRMHFPNMYFWRTYDQKEIDYIEESNGKLYAYEFKWNSKTNTKVPKLFMEHYPNSEFNCIHPENITNFLITTP